MITLQVQAFKRWLKVPVGKLIPETVLPEKLFGEEMLKLRWQSMFAIWIFQQFLDVLNRVQDINIRIKFLNPPDNSMEQMNLRIFNQYLYPETTGSCECAYTQYRTMISIGIGTGVCGKSFRRTSSRWNSCI